MKVLVDMNLSPQWIPVLEANGWPALHWSTIGDPRAADATILAWAHTNGYIVFTHDLDFGALLAATQANGPSVIQVRAQDVLPGQMSNTIVAALRQHEAVLEAGALVSVDEVTSRARVLPLRR